MTPVEALLATLLPGDGDWPPGSCVAHELAATLGADPALGEIISALPPGFAAGDEDALRRVEAAHTVAFERVVAAAYIEYYTAPTVREAIARITGYENRPPQPLGYALPPFDETLLNTQKRRAPFWRDPDKEIP